MFTLLTIIVLYKNILYQSYRECGKLRDISAVIAVHPSEIITMKTKV